MHTTLAFIGGLGGWEVLVIVLVLVIFFGAKRIPELARGLGKGIREFKDATKEIKDEIEEGNRTTTSK
jgi:sec-independent protein translocase protein TatA